MNFPIQLDDNCAIANGHVRIGVVGYSSPIRFDSDVARGLIIDAYDEIAERYSDEPIAIVSNPLNADVFAIAYGEAVKRGWTTVNAVCNREIERELLRANERLMIDGGSGESTDFVSILDGIICLGIDSQSAREIDGVRAQGLPVWDYDLAVLS